MVAKAMVHTPPILVLDEPTAGVDIELRRELWNNVRALNEIGTTILLTTHYLEEAQELCDKIAIINHGKIVVCEDKDALLARIDQKEITFRVDRDIETLPAPLKDFGMEAHGKRRLKYQYSPGETPVSEMIDLIRGAGFQIADISTDESDLEDVFIQLTSSAA